MWSKQEGAHAPCWHHPTSPRRPSCRCRSPAPLGSAARPVLPRTLLAYDAKAGMAGVGMAGGYGINGANVMQGLMGRVAQDPAGPTVTAAAPVARAGSRKLKM